MGIVYIEQFPLLFAFPCGPSSLISYLVSLFSDLFLIYEQGCSIFEMRIVQQWANLNFGSMILRLGLQSGLIQYHYVVNHA
jgi:hypothetical protein